MVQLRDKRGRFIEKYPHPIKVCKDCGRVANTLEEIENFFTKHKASPLGYRNWCKKCAAKYRKERRKENPNLAEDNRERQRRYREKHGQRILFNGKRIYTGRQIRTGVCGECGQSDLLTQIHHDIYDSDNPLAYTRELCLSCHAKTHGFGSKIHP